MNGELLSLIDTIVRDKGIDREVLIQAIETAMASAAKKGTAQDKEVTVTIDRQTGRLAVVSDGKAIASAEFSRIGAQTAKQVIMQKIREAERDVIYGEFQGRVGSIISGTVHRFERGDIIVDMGRTEGILPKAERIPHEDFQQGDHVQAYILEVRKGLKGTEVVLSRAHEGFIRGLFALEVPEISDGTVEIKGIAREPGDRTKIAVASTDEKVDSQGACIGMRGTRVKNIVRELHGERVDVIRWHADTKPFIAAALAPAEIVDLKMNAEAQQAIVFVNDDQLSLAIGKRGQNVRLASKLTGWQLEIQSTAPAAATAALELSSLKGVGASVEERLKEGGITTVEQLAQATPEQLTAIKGVGDKTAQKLIDTAKEALEAAKAQAAHAAAAAAAAVTHTESAPVPPADQASPVPAGEEVSTAAGPSAEEAPAPEAPPSSESTGEPTSEPA